MNETELLNEWKNQSVVERRAMLRGYRQGFIQGVLVGMLGAAVLVLAMTELLWWTN